MKASTVIAVAAGLTAYTVSAQLDAIPECALSCAITSLGSTGCGTTDIACICSNTAFVTSLVPCVQGACSASDFQATVAAATALCKSAGVTLNIPSGGASSSSAAPSSTTETTSVTVSVPVTSTSVTVVVPPVTNTTTTEVPVPEPTSGNATSTVTPPAPSGTDGSSAVRNTVTLGGLGALVAFVAALL